MTTTTKTEIPKKLDGRVASRIVEESYGPGAWHGSDLKAALSDVSAEAAFWRPGAGKHNIAEIALHHAWVARSVRGQLTATTPEEFVLQGEDWFVLEDGKPMSWRDIQKVVDEQQRKLAAVVNGRDLNPERFDLVLGAACHAIYHAGQIQLIKRLRA